MASMFICNTGFHAVLLRQSSRCEKDVWEIEKIEKYRQANVYVEICMILCVCMCMCE